MSKKKRLSTLQVIRNEARVRLSTIEHNLTRKLYMQNAEKFIRYCRETHHVKSLDDCKEYLQSYCDSLCLAGYTASTINAYLAAACRCFPEEKLLSTIKKPVRSTAEYIRGRNLNMPILTPNSSERFRTLLQFQDAVGLRRSEIAKLKGKDLVYDESGYLCVQVVRGKGGKYQLQRIQPKDYQFVSQLFKQKREDELIFTPETMKNKLNLHAVRAQHARDVYADYVFRINHESGYAQALEAEILARWNKYNINSRTGLPKAFDFSEIRGTYTLRASNRKFAIEHGLPIHYDKLALLATSIFSLSHWRNNVTVTSYLLAV